MGVNATGVFISSGSSLSRYAASDGHLEWKRELAGVLSRPESAGDRVFVGGCPLGPGGLGGRQLALRYAAGLSGLDRGQLELGGVDQPGIVGLDLVTVLEGEEGLQGG